MKSKTAPSTPAQSNGIRVVTSTRSINHSVNPSMSPPLQSPPRDRTVSGDHSGMGSTDQSNNQSNSRFWSAVSTTVKFLSNLTLDDDLSPTESTNQSTNPPSRTTRSKSHSGSSTGYISPANQSTSQSNTNLLASQSFDQSSINQSITSSNDPSINQTSLIREKSDSEHTKSAANRSQSAIDPTAIQAATQSVSQSSTLSPSTSNQSISQSSFDRLLEADTADLAKLRKVSWRGIPRQHRGQVWKILLGYLPLRKSKRDNLLLKRRLEYVQMIKADYLPVEQAMKQMNPGSINQSINSSIHLDETSRTIIQQIKQDVPRTSPANPFFKQPIIQESLTRILFLFALRHPASGYVQGINDLLTPFYATFFHELALEKPEIITKQSSDQQQLDEEGQPISADPSSSTPSSRSNSPSINRSSSLLDSICPFPLPLECSLSESDLLGLESDCFWCLSAFLDRIQDHYIFAQPGIQRGVWLLQHLTETIQPELAQHLDEQGVTFMHFAFRWMNCLLMREMSLKCTIRLFDTYLCVDPGTVITPPTLQKSNSQLALGSVQPVQSTSQSINQSIDHRSGFGQFHIYVCLAFLLYFAPKLKQMEFQDLILFLQKLPTTQWDMAEMDSLIAQAFVYQNIE